jgi:ABC-2 type transport system ATP-binding protein
MTVGAVERRMVTGQAIRPAHEGSNVMSGQTATIEARGLTKRFGSTLAVDELSFEVYPGQVTGFLGPNGAGKSTTLRMILGLDRPTAGEALVNGRPFVEYERPLFEVGALLDPKAFHPGRSARSHLRTLALSNGIGGERVAEVLDIVGLAGVGDRRAGGFSLGMGQRLGIASALLGDPGILILDEPVNGLDPDGILWIRNLLRSLASEGRTVLVSSHLMSEMALTADQLIIVGQGALLADDSVENVVDASGHNSVRVRTPQADELVMVLASEGLSSREDNANQLTVDTSSTDRIGELAAQHRITIHELTLVQASLEEAYMELTHDSLTYQSEAVTSLDESAA